MPSGPGTKTIMSLTRRTYGEFNKNVLATSRNRVEARILLSRGKGHKKHGSTRKMYAKAARRAKKGLFAFGTDQC